MRRIHTRSGRNRESGVVILLVAVVLLFVVGAMAALAIDVVSLYTARSEAQLAADAAALAGARVLANSGMTSDPTDATLTTNAENLATTIATRVAMNNEVGGRTLLSGEVTVTFNVAAPTNPRVTVKTGRTDLPTFFARIWGNSALSVAATATAEAYNPSGAATPPLTGPITPVAPTCVKPWVLPNLDPTPTGGPIFDPATGAIQDTTMLTWDGSSQRMWSRCQNCNSGPPSTRTPSPWRYYAGAPASFPAPSASSVACPGSAGFTAYQLRVAGCVQTPIACNSTVNIDMSDYGLFRDEQTTDAVNCLTHSTATPNDGDSIDTVSLPSPPFQFLAGADNPVVQAGAVAAGTDILVSDSLVTVPVYNSTTGVVPTSPVTIIGFVQLFLNPDGLGVPNGPPNEDHILTRIVNLAGCGTGATGQPILGNGASPVPVRLVTPP